MSSTASDTLKNRIVATIEKVLEEQAEEYGDWMTERWVSQSEWDKGTVYLSFDGNIPLEKMADALIEEIKKAE